MDSKDSSGNSSQPMLKAEQETVHQFVKPCFLKISKVWLVDRFIGKFGQQF